NHPDARRLADRAANRVRTVRQGLALLALLALLAGLAVAGALRRARRLSDLRTRWIASVSHELRTPVAALSLVAERLEKTRTSRPERLVEYHDAVQLETRRLARLVAQVMDLSRAERGQPPALVLTEVDPATELAAICDGLQPMVAAAGFDLEVERGALPPRASLDVAALGRVVENLVRNAVEHSGGRRLLVEWRADGDRMRLHVRDDGRGIERRESLFQPFQRGRHADPSRGVGLGLGIARELVRAHGGELQVVDSTARWPGANLALELPLTSSKQATTAQP
ncbi:MAG: HAMP domain-containing sensor histidine kinase, partial [Planctomycetota bacterium]